MVERGLCKPEVVGSNPIVSTTTQLFRQLVNEITLLLAYEATKELHTEEVEVETPLEVTPARRVSGKKVTKSMLASFRPRTSRCASSSFMDRRLS